ncbi:hypothetical protein [Acinetobacter tjernbergiae]|jgi:hypothetical protein|uniref:Uncharacterized protein n=1 Tax=Acinetobacter tjernbergiae DSM 14971 = CIP 107465 TaxID=1120928 RepID=V2WC06_9GAMM|nr:hypothetical protein [Acinetobacter tjernbergiae]ESK57554.1 hypothetical protein F990_00090 [Acinetobacter tjernbergiae DSM 14971 = CIP 107465]
MDFLAPITDKLLQRKVEELEATPKNRPQSQPIATPAVQTVKRDDPIFKKRRWY